MSSPPIFQESDLPQEALDLTLPELPDVTGRRVCMIIPHSGFRDEELFQVKDNLERSRVRVMIACSSVSAASGMFGSEITPDMLLDHVNPVDFDAIILVGGFGIDRYFKHPQLHRVVQEAYRMERIVAATSTAPAILALAGLLKGRKATTWVGPTNDKYLKILRLSGCKFTGENVEVDWPLITADDSNSMLEFSEVMVEALAEVIRIEAEEVAKDKRVEFKVLPEDQSQTPSEAGPRFKVVEPGPGISPEATPRSHSQATARPANGNGHGNGYGNGNGSGTPIGPASTPTTLPRFVVVEPGPGMDNDAPSKVEQVMAEQTPSPWARPKTQPQPSGPSNPATGRSRIKPDPPQSTAGHFY